MVLGVHLFGLNEAALMIALGVGFIVFCKAKKEGQPLQMVGRIIGIFIITISIFSIILNVINVARFYRSVKLAQEQQAAAQKANPTVAPKK